jgi:hypothetical protein
MVNLDGSEDLRKFGPFNVDRASTGQFVPKGSIDNPIDEYDDSKTKGTRHARSSRRRVGNEKETVNLDGSEDLRKFGPFNVDRAPTG